jgi:diguanylate cyclase (GGDEF)-like protein
MRYLSTQIADFFSKLSRRNTTVFVLLLISLLGVLNYVSGFEITFSFFYLLPVAIATLYLGRAEGRMTVVMSVLIWAVSNRLAGELYSREIIRYWNIGIRLVVFILFAELLYELKQALANEQILSRTDFLTGINNRREFYNRTDLEILRAKRYGHPTTIALLDLDSFKQVNDQLGHSEGDKLLKIIAQTISSTVRKTDVAARMGGDEFVLLFPDTDQNEAYFAIEKVRTALAGTINNTGLAVTFSLGVITFLSTPESVDAMLNKADKLMYSAKERGKNEVAYQTDGE